MSADGPQTWPALVAWLIARTPLVLVACFIVIYFGSVVVMIIGGTPMGKALNPRNFIGRDCIQLSEQAGRVFQVDQCAGTVTEVLPPDIETGP